ncbi:MAG: thioredoxin-disulfide reductase [Patescibacteria group bacterium]
MTHKIAIIGSGPAALTAAIYAGRAKLEPILFEGITPGGALMTTTVIENFPGFPDGIYGPKLIESMKEQALRFETKMVSKQVTAVDFSSLPFKIFVGDDREEYLADAVIIATGTESRKLGLESEKRLAARGVSYCATCDGPLFKNKKVAVIGGGDSAMEEAIFMTKYASEVTVIHRCPEVTASKIMIERAQKNEKIKWLLDVDIKEFVGENKLEKIRFVRNGTQEDGEIEVDGAFLAIGRIPNTQLFEGMLKMERGYILTESNSTRTEIPGIFSAGDVSDSYYRQAIVASGRGAMAAIEAERYLTGMKKA